MDELDLEIMRRNSWRAIDSCMLRLKWLAAATRFELAMRRHDRALKYGYDPNQPRDDYGKWSNEGSSGRIRLAGDVPTNDPPEIPKEKPPTSRERTAMLKIAAERLAQFGGAVGRIAEAAAWLSTYSPQIESYRDPPKSLEELQQGVSTPAPGYDIHHIVEQAQAERDGFTREVIDSPDNLVRIPTLKHQEINGWYQRENPDFDWQTPREYLSGRNWEVRRAVGLEALRIRGVLKP